MLVIVFFAKLIKLSGLSHTFRTAFRKIIVQISSYFLL